jgi:hypothetical protein
MDPYFRKQLGLDDDNEPVSEIIKSDKTAPDRTIVVRIEIVIRSSSFSQESNEADWLDYKAWGIGQEPGQQEDLAA